mgnify:CR=1 FL=1|jgi:hypothetical protein|tara:strand:- start:306 stop:662 length:357 start_codon:yes stop_codon:yes gene_type:complete
MDGLVSVLIAKEKKDNDLNNESVRQKEKLRAMFNNVKNNTNRNPYLHDVIDGYVEHFYNIKNEREKQYNALDILAQHVEKIYEGDNLTDTMINECKSDKHQLVREMEKTRNIINQIND